MEDLHYARVADIRDVNITHPVHRRVLRVLEAMGIDAASPVRIAARLRRRTVRLHQTVASEFKIGCGVARGTGSSGSAPAGRQRIEKKKDRTLWRKVNIALGIDLNPVGKGKDAAVSR
jgi:hypothetical protein